MILPVIWIETLHSPECYSRHQIEHALAIATLLGRGRFVLAIPPAR